MIREGFEKGPEMSDVGKVDGAGVRSSDVDGVIVGDLGFDGKHGFICLVISDGEGGFAIPIVKECFNGGSFTDLLAGNLDNLLAMVNRGREAGG